MPYGAFREVFRCTNMYNEEETMEVGEQKKSESGEPDPDGIRREADNQAAYFIFFLAFLGFFSLAAGFSSS